MSVFRKWYCACTGKPREMSYERVREDDEEAGSNEPFCPKCGATPSSDPKKDVMYRDIEDWED